MVYVIEDKGSRIEDQGGAIASHAILGVPSEHLLSCAYGPKVVISAGAEAGKVLCYRCQDWVVEGSMCPGQYHVSTCGHGRG